MPAHNLESLVVTSRSSLRRKRDRGSHDRELVYAILDEGLLCHVGRADGDSMFVQPMAYGRVEDRLYLHGAAGNRLLGLLAQGTPACVTVTLLDGLVFARSAFHHSMTYRSVMLFGQADTVVEEDEKRVAMLAVLDHMAPGRSRDARPPSPTELRVTSVVRFPITEGSAKVRTGGPVDEPEDLHLPIWAGELPLELQHGAPADAEGLGLGVVPPAYVQAYQSRGEGWRPRRSPGHRA